MRKDFRVPLLFCTAAAMVPEAHADVTFHGYGQVVGGTLFSNNRSFPTTSSQGYNADPNFQPDSNFALQATAPLSNSISATAQVLARGADNFEPKFQWAYIKFQLNDTWAVKAGRMETPLYQYSDYQFVGEAYPWVVPPEAVYANIASHFDGVSVSAQKNIGDWFFYMQGVYGAFEDTTDIPASAGGGSVTSKSHNFTGLKLEGNYNDWLNFDAAYYVLKTSIDGTGPYASIDGLATWLDSIGQPQAAKDLTVSNDLIGYYTGGLQVNYKNFLVLAELAGIMPVHGVSTSPNFVSEYISLGYRFNKLLPLITVGHRNWWASGQKIKDDIPSNALTTTVPQINPLTGTYYTVQQATQGLTSVLPVSTVFYPAVDAIVDSPSVRQKDWFYEATLRYDLTSNVALKLDYTFYDSHWHTTDYAAASALGGFSNPTDASRLLAAVTFSF